MVESPVPLVVQKRQRPLRRGKVDCDIRGEGVTAEFTAVLVLQIDIDDVLIDGDFERDQLLCRLVNLESDTARVDATSSRYHVLKELPVREWSDPLEARRLEYPPDITHWRPRGSGPAVPTTCCRRPLVRTASCRQISAAVRSEASHEGPRRSPSAP